MVYLNEKLHLEAMRISVQDKLLSLMLEIYPPIYSYLWIDDGESYLKGLYSEANLRLELEKPNSHYYFIKYEGQIVGILRIVVNNLVPDLMNKLMVKLQRIYLSQRVQGKGIGKQILNWVEEEFCREKSIPLWLEVMDSQKQAIGFYEKIGFVKSGRFVFNSNMMKEEYRGMYRMIKEYK